MQRETPPASEAVQHTPLPAPETDRPSITILPTNRVEALADGIVAIATTLLVFEIKQPLVQGGLTGALLRQWPSYATYVVSFLTIAIIWVNHHDLMSMVARVDRTFLFLITFMLMGLCAIPFPTGLLGHYLQAGHDQRPAAVAYALVMVFTVSMFPIMWLHLAANPHLLHEIRRPKRCVVAASSAGRCSAPASMRPRWPSRWFRLRQPFSPMRWWRSATSCRRCRPGGPEVV
jgi:uncharacterized membrane protein